MGLSQIDMLSLVPGQRGTLLVCGPLVLESDESPDDNAFFAVVRQDDLVAVGRGGTRESPTGDRWLIRAVDPNGGAFQTGPAVASVTITLRKENPPGLETLSWVQPFTILSEPVAPPSGPPPDLAALVSEVVPTQEGTLTLTGQSVASSLAIRKQPTAAAGLTHTWRHQLKLLRIPDPD